MDLVKVLHMNGGVGKTSYAENSSVQKKASDMVKHIIIEAIEELYLATTPKSIGIADLGCSSGPNTLSIIKDIFEAIQGVCNKIMMQNPSEFRVYLNDLPTNDFNSIFKALPEFHRLLKQDSKIKNGFPSIFIGAYPGSFYGRLFPNNYLHFVYSSYSLHWLSRVPPALYDEQGKPLNKGSIYISESSPEVVPKAYLEQFKEDFSLFLRSRSEELVVDGRMVLIFLGRRGQEHVDRGSTTFFWHLLSRSFDILISQGEIKQEKLDSYDMPFYAPSREEIEEEVRKEGLLKLERLEMFDMDTFPQGVAKSYGTMVAMGARVTQESLISNHFGEKILDNLFENYARLVDEEMAKEDIKPTITYFALVLRKI